VKVKLITSVEVKTGRYQNVKPFKSVSSSNVEILNYFFASIGKPYLLKIRLIP
jgi:hypothetical protein